MANVLEIIIGTITGVARSFSNTIEGIQDFFLVRVSGLSFVVFGSRQVGKTTLIEWLRRNMHSIEGFEPEPTPAGGNLVQDFGANLDGTALKLKPSRDVGGEYGMWETDWIELFRESQPRGIIFMIDHTDSAAQKDALNFVLQMIDDEAHAAQNLQAFFVLINKSDVWEDTMTTEEIELRYRNEKRRLATLADRKGFKWAMASGSLSTGYGVRAFMKQFFNTIRPQRQRISQ